MAELQWKHLMFVKHKFTIPNFTINRWFFHHSQMGGYNCVHHITLYGSHMVPMYSMPWVLHVQVTAITAKSNQGCRAIRLDIRYHSMLRGETFLGAKWLPFPSNVLVGCYVWLPLGTLKQMVDYPCIGWVIPVPLWYHQRSNKKCSTM